MFDPFQKFIQNAARNYGISTEVEAAKVCENFRKIIPEIFSNTKNASDYIEPANFKNNILVIDVENPGWAQEIIVRKSKIIEEINKKAGKEIIKNLRTRLKQ